MATFLYTAVNKENKYVKDAIESRSQKKAIATLEQAGFLVVNIKQEHNSQLSRVLQLSTIRRIDKIVFTRHLHTLLESGIALDQALKIAGEQSGNASLKKVLFDLYENVKKGEAFNVALSRHGKYFSPFFVNLIKVGEKSGTLDAVLLHLLEQQEQDYELLTKTRSAMIYPAIIIAAALAIVTLMMTFVVPTITELLVEYSVEIPLSTKILIFISSTLNTYGLFIALALLIAGLSLYFWVKKPQGKRVWDAVKLRIPVVKNIVKDFNLARITRSMSSLLKSGISLDEGLQLAASVCGNVYYQESLKASVLVVRKGVPLTEALHGYPALYPPMSTRMLEIGEKTGKLDHMFSRLAVFYEKSVLTTILNLSSIIEPVLLLVIGLGVGFVAVSILTPIWSFAQSI